MSYTHLTAHERYCIAHMHMAKYAIRLIAKNLNRAPSTISREVKRNKGRCSPYWYDWAQQYAGERKAAPRYGKRRSHAKLYDLVMQNIRLGLSPKSGSVLTFQHLVIAENKQGPELRFF